MVDTHLGRWEESFYNAVGRGEIEKISREERDQQTIYTFSHTFKVCSLITLCVLEYFKYRAMEFKCKIRRNKKL